MKRWIAILMIFCLALGCMTACKSKDDGKSAAAGSYVEGETYTGDNAEIIENQGGGKDPTTDSSGGNTDGGNNDGGNTDSGNNDGGNTDGGNTDGGNNDGGNNDGGNNDGGNNGGENTDGGNTECILHNAKMLASVNPKFPIVIAGNRTAARQCPLS